MTEEGRTGHDDEEPARRVREAIERLHVAEKDAFSANMRKWGRIVLFVSGSVLLPLVAAVIFLVTSGLGVAPAALEAERVNDFVLFVVLPASGVLVGTIVGFLVGPRSRLLAASIGLPWIVCSSFLPLMHEGSTLTEKELYAHAFLLVMLAAGSILSGLFRRASVAYRSIRREL